MTYFAVLLIGKTDYLICLDVSYTDRMVADISAGTQKMFVQWEQELFNIKIYSILWSLGCR